MSTYWGIFFYDKWGLNFDKKLFFLTSWDNHVAFIFQICYCGVSQYWFVDIEKFLYSKDKSHLTMVSGAF